MRAPFPPSAGRESGFSLVEVLSAVAIFGVVALGTAAGTISTIRGNTVSRMSLAAGNLLCDQVEKFRALDMATHPSHLTQGNHQDPSNPVTAPRTESS